MARLGTKARPLIVRVQSDDRAYYVAETCARHGWEYIMGLEPDKPEDLSDLEKMLHPNVSARSSKIDRNAPCPCGSGKKYKKCCGAIATLTA